MSKKTAYQTINPNLRPPKMQHVRHVKPEYFVHEEVNNMSVNARLAEIGTWTCCDKDGRFEWKPRMLKRLVMPYDDVDFESLMDEWKSQGFVQKYQVCGETYGQFFNWDKHQGINLREKQSAFGFPEPPTPELPNGVSKKKARVRTKAARADTCAHVSARAPSEGKGKGECQGEVEEKGEVELEVQGAPETPSHENGVVSVSKKAAQPNQSKPSTAVSFLSPDLTGPDEVEDPDAGNENQKHHIGEIQTDSLEEMLDVLSDGTFENGALQNCDLSSDDLKTACVQAITKYRDFPMTDRSSLVPVFNNVMDNIRQQGLSWPPGFLPVVKLLRAGGPLKMPHDLSRRAKFVRGKVFGAGSLLTLPEWGDLLRPHEEVLQKIADDEGVPQTFIEGVDFLQHVHDYLWEKDGMYPPDLERAQRLMYERVPTRRDTKRVLIGQD